MHTVDGQEDREFERDEAYQQFLDEQDVRETLADELNDELRDIMSGER